MKVTGREGRGGNFFSECERSVDTNVRRGDIYYADLSPVVGSEQGGVRPVLIIQNDTGNRYSPTVIAAAITSQTNKAKLPTHIALSAPDHGLPRDSVVLLEQVRTLDKRRLRERMGRVDGELMEVSGSKSLMVGAVVLTVMTGFMPIRSARSPVP